MGKEYIDRNELIERLRGDCPARVMDIIEDVDDADVVPVVHGEWEFISLDGSLWCSRCKRMSGYGRKAENKYCRNCGTKMDGGK